MKQKSTLLIYVLLLLIMTITACSKEDNNNSSKSSPSISPKAGSPTSISSVTGSPSSISSVTGSPSDTVITPTMPRKPINTVIPTEAANDGTDGQLGTQEGIREVKGTKVQVKITQKKSSHKKAAAKLIAIDAGHQSKGNNDKEPIGPGADTKKPKVSSGTSGNYTGVAEYKLNLTIALKVKKELRTRGYKVYMIRETNDVNLSNRERAEMANESGADVFIRIHADSSTDSSVHGTSTLYPSKHNPFVPKLSKDSYNLSKSIVDAICNNTGSKNRGAIAHDDMSGINWCKIPVSIIEMGYMSNKSEDKLMQTNKYQDKIVTGICDGIDAYFE